MSWPRSVMIISIFCLLRLLTMRPVSASKVRLPVPFLLPDLGRHVLSRLESHPGFDADQQQLGRFGVRPLEREDLIDREGPEPGNGHLEGLAAQVFPGSTELRREGRGLDCRSSLRPCSEIDALPGRVLRYSFAKVLQGLLGDLEIIDLAGRPERERELRAGQGLDLSLDRFELVGNFVFVRTGVELERHERRLLDAHPHAVESKHDFGVSIRGDALDGPAQVHGIRSCRFLVSTLSPGRSPPALTSIV